MLGDHFSPESFTATMTSRGWISLAIPLAYQKIRVAKCLLIIAVHTEHVEYL